MGLWLAWVAPVPPLWIRRVPPSVLSPHLCALAVWGPRFAMWLSRLAASSRSWKWAQSAVAAVASCISAAAACAACRAAFASALFCSSCLLILLSIWRLVASMTGPPFPLLWRMPQRLSGWRSGCGACGCGAWLGQRSPLLLLGAVCRVALTASCWLMGGGHWPPCPPRCTAHRKPPHEQSLSS